MLNTMTGAVRIRLSEILTERKILQKEFSASSGLSENTISDLTNNAVRQIRLDTLAKLCDTLSLRPGDLLDYTPDPEKSEAT